MRDFLNEVRLAMGNSKLHVIGDCLSAKEWRTAGCPHTWKQVAVSSDGDTIVWQDTTYGLIACQWMDDGQECFGVHQAMIVTPCFLAINCTLYPEVMNYLWKMGA